ncbi:hypothetical protein B0H10DRAFT_1959830 [Mycena sp. CBHHK59/15]|nr:hypothetical protein B0H10DRAFT_1959830 [Mycena sp. CBHHK59/15]
MLIQTRSSLRVVAAEEPNQSPGIPWRFSRFPQTTVLHEAYGFADTSPTYLCVWLCESVQTMGNPPPNIDASVLVLNRIDARVRHFCSWLVGHAVELSSSASKWLEIPLTHLHHAVGLATSVAPRSGPSGERQGESTTQWAPAASGKLRTAGPAASAKGGLPHARGFMKGRNKHEKYIFLVIAEPKTQGMCRPAKGGGSGWNTVPPSGT